MLIFKGKYTQDFHNILESAKLHGSAPRNYENFWLKARKGFAVKNSSNVQISDDCIFAVIENLNIRRTITSGRICERHDIILFPSSVSVSENFPKEIVEFFKKFIPPALDDKTLISIYPPSKNLLLNLPRIFNNRYEIISKIADGGMGKVYEVKDILLNNRILALKEMSNFADKTALKLFQQEAKILSQLNHPNIPHVYDFFGDACNYYLVMELIAGETLEVKIQRKRNRCFKQKEALHISIQILSALQHLHSQNPPIIYRDLKPANIMIETKKGRLKLIDFGISRFFKVGNSKDTVEFGTPGYSPPEQYGKGQTDERSDIYSFGALLHYLISGVDPMLKPFTFNPHPNISPKLFKLLVRCVKNDPAKRYKSIKTLRKEVEKLC